MSTFCIEAQADAGCPNRGKRSLTKMDKQGSVRSGSRIGHISADAIKYLVTIIMPCIYFRYRALCFVCVFLCNKIEIA